MLITGAQPLRVAVRALRIVNAVPDWPAHLMPDRLRTKKGLTMTKGLTKVPDSAAIRSVSDAPPPSPEAARVVAPLTAIEIAVIVLAVIAVIAAARVAMTFLVPVVAGILLSYTLRPL